MRNWNLYIFFLIWTYVRKFSSYLWGIETDWALQESAKLAVFSSYLWGIETQVDKPFVVFRSFSFHLTYEELKQTGVFWKTRIDWQWVFILPMRNWNRDMCRGRNEHSGNEFSSYLWGIETIEIFRIEGVGFQRFHLTYEELKPKLLSRVSKSAWTFSSYLWGIETSPGNWDGMGGKSVFILPMRNWNSLLLKRRKNVLFVFILPMRNWNIESAAKLTDDRIEFSSYLWGIETVDVAS